jgi:hypothetical protein
MNSPKTGLERVSAQRPISDPRLIEQGEKQNLPKEIQKEANATKAKIIVKKLDTINLSIPPKAHKKRGRKPKASLASHAHEPQIPSKPSEKKLLEKRQKKNKQNLPQKNYSCKNSGENTKKSRKTVVDEANQSENDASVTFESVYSDNIDSDYSNTVLTLKEFSGERAFIGKSTHSSSNHFGELPSREGPYIEMTLGELFQLFQENESQSSSNGNSARGEYRCRHCQKSFATHQALGKT